MLRSGTWDIRYGDGLSDGFRANYKYKLPKAHLTKIYETFSVPYQERAVKLARNTAKLVRITVNVS